MLLFMYCWDDFYLKRLKVNCCYKILSKYVVKNKKCMQFSQQLLDNSITVLDVLNASFEEINFSVK